MHKIIALLIIILPISVFGKDCISITNYQPADGSKIDASSWEPNKGDIPLTINDVISKFNANKDYIIKLALKYDKSNYQGIVENKNKYSASIYKISLKHDFTFGWHYIFQFDLNLYIGDNNLYIYQDKPEYGSKHSPSIYLTLDGVLLFPNFESCS